MEHVGSYSRILLYLFWPLCLVAISKIKMFMQLTLPESEVKAAVP